MDSKDQERLDKQINKDGPHIPGMALPCWEWKGSTDNQGRPRFWFKGSSAYANRVRFLLQGVPIGPEDHVVTLCRNRGCVRPEHHFLGTAKDARILGQAGGMGPGDICLMRTLHVEGKVEAKHIVLSYDISLHVAEAILQEGDSLHPV